MHDQASVRLVDHGMPMLQYLQDHITNALAGLFYDDVLEIHYYHL